MQRDRREETDSKVAKARQAVHEAHRIVVKVGSSSLTTATGGLDADRVDALVDVLAKHRSGGEKEIVLVSSGAIAVSLAPLGLRRRPKDLARQQAAASVGQGLLVARYTASCARHGVRVGQVLLTSDDTSRRAHHRNAARTLDKLLAMGALPVVNENDTVATDEIRFGDNDRLAALVAHLVRADLLVLLSDVDGVYDGDPSKPGTSRIAEVRGPGDLAHVDIGTAGKAGVGTGGMVTKVEAARIAAAAGIPVVLTSAVHAAEALAGGDTGTYFHPTGKRSADRLLWLQHASTPQGALVLDDGAVRAVVDRRTSLLPHGYRGRRGRLHRGRPRRAARQHGTCGRTGSGELRRQGDSPAHRALDPRAGPRTGPGVRTRGRTQGRPRAPASVRRLFRATSETAVQYTRKRPIPRPPPGDVV